MGTSHLDGIKKKHLEFICGIVTMRTVSSVFPSLQYNNLYDTSQHASSGAPIILSNLQGVRVCERGRACVRA